MLLDESQETDTELLINRVGFRSFEVSGQLPNVQVRLGQKQLWPKLVVIGSTLLIAVALWVNLATTGSNLSFASAKSEKHGLVRLLSKSKPTDKTCLEETLKSIRSVPDWDNGAKNLPQNSQLINQVFLGGVEQLTISSACQPHTLATVVVDLVVENGSWKLKSAAPAGPHF